MTKNSKQKQVLITGASSDIGIAVCRRYLDDGARVIAHYRNNIDIFKMLQTDSGYNLIPLQTDFCNPEAAERLLAQKPEILKRTDVLINMAALREPITFEEVNPDDLLRHFTANVIPMVMLTQKLGPLMVERGWGRIVNISSIGVKFGGGQKTFCYSLTKYAMEFMPAIYKKWASANVLVNAVRVGVTDTRYFKRMSLERRKKRTDLIPMKRMAAPEDIAEVICWLGSERNTYITGQIITASGGE